MCINIWHLSQCTLIQLTYPERFFKHDQKQKLALTKVIQPNCNCFSNIYPPKSKALFMQAELSCELGINIVWKWLIKINVLSVHCHLGPVGVKSWEKCVFNSTDKTTSSYSHIWFHVPRILKMVSCSAESEKERKTERTETKQSNTSLIWWENENDSSLFQIFDSCKND